jgi:hypothetical protein
MGFVKVPLGIIQALCWTLMIREKGIVVGHGLWAGGTGEPAPCVAGRFAPGSVDGGRGWVRGTGPAAGRTAVGRVRAREEALRQDSGQVAVGRNSPGCQRR